MPRQSLRSFALDRLNAARYPNDRHIYVSFTCEECGEDRFDVLITHHSGSKSGNFRGVVKGTCKACGTVRNVLSFTGSHRKPEKEEHPHCSCGSFVFHVAECERIEGDDGLDGFFDEGILVGKCANCGRNMVFVETD